MKIYSNEKHKWKFALIYVFNALQVLLLRALKFLVQTRGRFFINFSTPSVKFSQAAYVSVEIFLFPFYFSAKTQTEILVRGKIIFVTENSIFANLITPSYEHHKTDWIFSSTNSKLIPPNLFVIKSILKCSPLLP